MVGFFKKRKDYPGDPSCVAKNKNGLCHKEKGNTKVGEEA